ncbi:MAG: Gfo/Idh/MocA family oxidoreductase [bacterium]|nr:Gfo/Idh/MocA family oxidoreductase [bacterium]
MAAKKIRVAVVGTGRWGKNILKILDALSECEVAYQATREWHGLLQKNDIDAVVVATPPATHAEIALPFVERRVPVFIEKPLAAGLEDAQKIAAAAQKSGSIVFVGHIHLYNPAYQAAKEQSKQIGPVRLLLGEGYNFGPVRPDYSAMWDYGSHDLSMMLDLMGEIPESVAAWGTATLRQGTALWDTAQMQLNFKNGTVGYIFSSSVMPQKRRHLTVVGEGGSVVYDDTLVEKKVLLYKKIDTVLEVSYPTYAPGSPLTLELQAFLNAIKTGTKPHTDAIAGLAVVAVLNAAEKSIAKNGGVAIKI